MSLNESDVDRIAQLARLGVEGAQRTAYSRDLSRILDLVEQMEGVDVQAVEPMAHPLDMKQRLRADEVTESDQRSQFQSVAPAVEQGLYLVPRVIERD
ncbi:MAG: Asp-tRNA(Asn)/Glu-tRNA(Gln) amidotransferase subunit GatC [Halothiobacillaceae bacterium]